MSVVPRGARYNPTPLGDYFKARIPKARIPYYSSICKGDRFSHFPDSISVLIEMPLVEQLHIVWEYPQAVTILYFPL